MSQNVLCIGDQHFMDKSLPICNILVEKIYSHLSQNKYDFVVLLGDLLHSHEVLKLFPHNLATRFLKKLASMIPTYLLIGNHDILNNSMFQTENHPFIALEDYPNLIIINKAKYIQIKDKNYFFVPYTPNGRFYEALLTTSSSEQQLLERFKTTTAIFGHQEFFGAQTGAIKSTKGDVWPLDRPLVISGHIHTFEILQPNIIYTGTPYQTSFDDSNDKTVSHFIFHQNSFDHHRIDLQMPKKRIVKINASELEDFKVPTDATIKLKITGTDSEIKALMKNDKIKELEKAGVLVSYNTLILKRSFEFNPEKKNISYIPRLQNKVAFYPRLGELLKNFI